MNEDKKISVDIAIDYIRQLIYLASGSVILSTTFIGELFTGDLKFTWILYIFWVSMLVSVIFGLNVYGSIIGNLAKKGSTSVLEKNTVWNAKICRWSFIIGLIFLVIFVISNSFMITRDRKIKKEITKIEGGLKDNEGKSSIKYKDK